MTWSRSPVAAALAQLLTSALDQSDECDAQVYEAPPFSLNADSIVIGRATEVRYSVQGFALDEVTLPITCVGGMDQDDTVAALIELVRSTVHASINLDGACSEIHAVGERGWRHVNVSGADLLAAEITLQVLM